eukprot:TRINITY_DN828_c0_g1_i8.p1 TRINITY_DN828_c0_g1~~TRINITY_DN828_c0_g1_i8.p1  ORF type:complete len:991 (-),score=211.04 TRINITY_DN828_c0_g1_i8:89-3061(-)
MECDELLRGEAPELEPTPPGKVNASTTSSGGLSGLNFLAQNYMPDGDDDDDDDDDDEDDDEPPYVVSVSSQQRTQVRQDDREQHYQQQTQQHIPVLFDNDDNDDGQDGAFQSKHAPARHPVTLGDASFSTQPSFRVVNREEQWKTNIGVGKDDLFCASTLIYNAWCGRTDRMYFDPICVRLYSFISSKRILWIMRLVVLVNLMLALIEKPALPAFVFVSPLVPLIIELTCLMIYCLNLLLNFKAVHRNFFFVRSKYWLLFFCIVATLVDIVVCWVFFEPSTFRWSRLLRPYFMVYMSDPIRMAVNNIRKIILDFIEMMVFISVIIVLFAIFMVTMFEGSGEASVEFPNYYMGFVNLYALMTTVNFPDIMMPIYIQYRLSPAIFIVFLMLTTFFAMNILLAIMYNTYRRTITDEYSVVLQHERENVATAFALLDPNKTGEVPENHVRYLVKSLRPHYSEEKVMLLYRLMCGRTHTVDITKFMSIINLLNIKLSSPKPTLCKTWNTLFPRIYSSRPSFLLIKFVKSIWFLAMMDLVIILNCIWLAVAYSDVRTNPTQGRFPFNSKLEDLFMLIFTMEVSLNFYAFGPYQFLKRFWNVFDVFILGCNYAGIVLAYFPDAKGHVASVIDIDILRLMYMMRLFRLFRLLNFLKRFREVMKVMRFLLPTLQTMFAIEMGVFYVFSLIGMGVWAGRISKDTPELQGTQFLEDKYWPNNFDDLLSSFVVCFELMVVNNWQVLASGYVAISGHWAYLYFILFNVFGVVLVVNIIIAVVLEAFEYLYLAKDEDDDYLTLVKANIEMLNSLGEKGTIRYPQLSPHQRDSLRDLDREAHQDQVVAEDDAFERTFVDSGINGEPKTLGNAYMSPYAGVPLTISSGRSNQAGQFLDLEVDIAGDRMSGDMNKYHQKGERRKQRDAYGYADNNDGSLLSAEEKRRSVAGSADGFSAGLMDLEDQDGSGYYGDNAERTAADIGDGERRSEERRVGKECRSRWSPYH